MTRRVRVAIFTSDSERKFLRTGPEAKLSATWRSSDSIHQNMSSAILPDLGTEKKAEGVGPERPHRPAWIEIDLGQLKRNFEIINLDKPRGVQWLSVVKDDAYGHGALRVARTAVENGAAFLALGSLDEGMALRQRGIMSPIILLGERQEAELPWCIEHRLTCCVNDVQGVEKLGEAAARMEPARASAFEGEHGHEPLRCAVGRGGEAGGDDCRDEVAGAGRGVEPFLDVGRKGQNFCAAATGAFQRSAGATGGEGRAGEIPALVQQRRFSGFAAGAF